MAQIDQGQVEHQVEKRERFHIGLFMHFTVYVIANVIVWLIWLLIPNKGFPAIPLIITGAWAIMLIVHGLIVAVAHKPDQVARDEVKREIQEQRLNNR